MGNTPIKNKKDAKFMITKEHFNFVKVIGRGGFGKVWKVKDKKTKKIYALKAIDKATVLSKKSVQSIMNEKELLATLAKQQSEFLVNLKYAFQDRQNCYLLIDYLEGGDLRYYINRKYSFNQDQIRFLMRCILQGLNVLHKKSIIHRDIKPENIILDSNGFAKITDLGIARYWKTQNSNETSGTPGYMAPEVLLRQNHSFCADYYAVGVIAFELFVGVRPYQGKDRRTIREEILSREAKIPSIKAAAGMSKQAVDFVSKLLQRTSRKRLGYNGMSQILNHPWLYKNKTERTGFLEKKGVSLIEPIEVWAGRSLQQETQHDDLWRQNALLLKRDDIQILFEGYQYNPITQQLTQSPKGSALTAQSISQPTFMLIKSIEES